MESERNPLRQVHSGHRGRREIVGAHMTRSPSSDVAL